MNIALARAVLTRAVDTGDWANDRHRNCEHGLLVFDDLARQYLCGICSARVDEARVAAASDSEILEDE